MSSVVRYFLHIEKKKKKKNDLRITQNQSIRSSAHHEVGCGNHIDVHKTSFPKDQGPSKVKVLRVQTPAMQGQNPP